MPRASCAEAHHQIYIVPQLSHTHRDATCFPGRIPVKTYDGSLLLQKIATSIKADLD